MEENKEKKNIRKEDEKGKWESFINYGKVSLTLGIKEPVKVLIHVFEIKEVSTTKPAGFLSVISRKS